MENKGSAEQNCCESRESYQVEAVVSVDSRGQVVLPKEVRENMGLAAGDKLAVVTLTQDGKPCCLMLTKAINLARSARDLISPLIENS